LVPGVKVFGGMSYLQSQSDTIDGDLAPNTVKLSRTVFAGLEVSSVEAYQAGTAAVPMSFILSTDAVQTGKNVEKPKSAIMSLSFYF
jgi:hypothetical protein